MFRKTEAPARTVTIFVDDVPVEAEPGELLAAVLLRVPPHWARTNPVSLAPRAPYCMMGVCFECLAVVDGAASVQTCLVEVADGMRVSRQHGKRRVI